MSMNSIRDTFFEECEDLLAALAEGLDEMATDSVDNEVVNAVFRAVHSMKGGAGAFGLDDLVGFAHTFETVLDNIRSNKLDMSEELLLVLQKSGDQLTDLVSSARDETPVDQATVAGVISELGGFLGADASASQAPAPDEEFVFDAVAFNFDDDASAAASTPNPADTNETVFKIQFRPFNSLFANGHEPILLFEALERLGTLDVCLNSETLSELHDLSVSEYGLSWDLTLTTQEPETALDEVFEFVEGLCDLRIVRQDLAASDDPAPALDLDAMFGAAPTPAPVAEEPLATVPDPPQKAQKPPQKTKVTPAAPPAKTEPKGPRPTLRVDLERVDRLINTVGELIINQAMIAQQIDKLQSHNVTDLQNDLEDYKLLAREIQEGVMAIRAQPVKPLFQRMGRIVREASEATGKRAKLVTIGDDTEVDKTVIERLADPLTHMIRNAVDHGLEDIETRKAAGKPDVGQIKLNASHRSGNVVIEISDDGAGLNRDKIKEIAITKGLIPADADLTENEIDNLLFLPGFSTVSKVSNLSGRGVGMDVVKNAVLALGGRISIASEPGKGSVFSVILPLTLAVLDGMVVSVGDETMVVPITSILETVRPTKTDIFPLGVDGNVLSIRGSYVPIIDVAQSLSFTANQQNSVPEVLLVVETDRHGVRALAVDAIHDQRQVVIKSLEGNYGKIPGVSAATILGDGKIALILDPDNIADLATNQSENSTAAEEDAQNVA
ncbi:chemotaxis protein CheW [Algirhabdus cladophorae]|uniref:chemotaxis protein CheW n=1 Tax=Algirhabdus cladophorae TaxID=3377108 RepID=UPI003B849789